MMEAQPELLFVLGIIILVLGIWAKWTKRR